MFSLHHVHVRENVLYVHMPLSQNALSFYCKKISRPPPINLDLSIASEHHSETSSTKIFRKIHMWVFSLHHVHVHENVL